MSSQPLRYTSVPSALIAAFLLIEITGCVPTGSDADVDPVASEMVSTKDPIQRGGSHFLRYCASCHGSDGRGNGPVAEALKDEPTDITQLRTENEGVFSVDGLIDIIRGNKDVLVHGTREMPVWGNIWDDPDGQAVAEEVVEARINELVEYIRSIQM